MAATPKAPPPLPEFHAIDASDAAEFVCLWCNLSGVSHAIYTYDSKKARYYFFTATHETCVNKSPNRAVFKYMVPLRVFP